jgi:cytochrome c-type biogenesis protein CcmE
VDVNPVEPGDPAGAPQLDLTPRDDSTPAPRQGRRWWTVGLLAAVVAVLGVVLYQGLGSATTYFYNIDQAVAKRSEIGTKRVRVQGNVVEGSVVRSNGGVDFQLKFGDVTIPVQHSGEPPELFGPKIPVVLEGAFTSATGAPVFRSDRILIRHDNSYDEEHGDRVTDAEKDADRPARP